MPTLATLLRPKNLDSYFGQSHLIGNNQPLKIALEKGHIFSMLFWGPPGVGKTTLAKILADQHDRDFYDLSAVSAKKSDIKEIIDQTRSQRTLTQSYTAPILFLDEIHRFNKAQQDYLLPYVEDGTIILIGATTENPSFEVISALLSRCKVFILKPLSPEEINQVIDKAIKYLDISKKELNKETRAWLVQYSNGDARKILTLIEQTLQSNQLSYDKKGEEHYNTISAFIKSMRASDADAALYYLARMVSAGEDPKFIARRMVIFASEDVGLAAPTALVVANAVFDAVTNIGYPEAQINLAHGVAYLSKCKKDRSSYDGYFKALKDVENLGNLPIPMQLRNAPTQLMKDAGYGKSYEMYPDKSKNLLPNKLKNKKYVN
jgi:putative ATPase